MPACVCAERPVITESISASAIQTVTISIPATIVETINASNSQTVVGSFVVSTNEILVIAVSKYAKKFAAAPTKGIGMIKKLINTSFEKTLDEALNGEAIAQDILGNSNDYKEGVNSFIEKRKPVFKGN